MSADTGGGAITLSGPPHNATAVARLDPTGDAIVPVTIKVGGEISLHRAYVRPFGRGTSRIRLKLPRETPPGTYRGEASVNGVPHPIIVDVAPVVRTRVQPRRTHVDVAAGERADFEITVANGGNIAVDVPRTSVLDLDDGDAQDRALGRALRATLPEGESRVDRFFDELRRSHGGEARVTVADGAGALEPGHSRTLRCRIEVPMTAATDHSYRGAWRIGNVAHLLDVTVSKPASRESVARTKE